MPPEPEAAVPPAVAAVQAAVRVLMVAALLEQMLVRVVMALQAAAVVRVVEDVAAEVIDRQHG